MPWVAGAMHVASQACRYPWQGAWKGRGSVNRVDVGPMTSQEKTKHLPLAQPELLTHMTTQCMKQSLGKHLLSATSKGGRTNMRIRIHVTESYIRVTVLPPHERVQEIN